MTGSTSCVPPCQQPRRRSRCSPSRRRTTEVIRSRLRKLHDSADLRRRYVEVVRDLWSAVRDDWERWGRVAVDVVADARLDALAQGSGLARGRPPALRPRRPAPPGGHCQGARHAGGGGAGLLHPPGPHRGPARHGGGRHPGRHIGHGGPNPAPRPSPSGSRPSRIRLAFAILGPRSGEDRAPSRSWRRRSRSPSRR